MKEIFRFFNYLNQEELNYIGANTTLIELKKKEFLIKEGEISLEIVFIKEGMLRFFHTTKNGDEFTYRIAFKNTLMTATSSYVSGLPTLENIQALVPTQLEVIHKKHLKSLMKKGSNMLKLEKFLLEKQYIDLEHRLFSFQKEKAVERYLELLETQPELLKKIPLQHLASYLGITMPHLSRIRKSIL